MTKELGVKTDIVSASIGNSPEAVDGICPAARRHEWETSRLTSEEEVFQRLSILCSKQWFCRGHSRRCDGDHVPYGLVPSIDRGRKLRDLSREKKLILERRSIDIFRSTVRSFSDRGEEGALTDDIIALMVIRHHGVPTRLLDWSQSPYVAAWFASQDDSGDGEIWSFDEPFYEGVAGPKQWRDFPETTIDGSGRGEKFDARLTAFAIEDPNPWITCNFYPLGFSRQNAQRGAYTMTPDFGVDHADRIASLFSRDQSRYRLYVIPKDVKKEVRRRLREEHGIWRGSLYPDSAGSADTAWKEVFADYSPCDTCSFHRR